MLPGYEERKAQIKLSEAVGDVLEHGGLLLAEAGTGTGKTLAYLLPAVLSERRVVISTGTKNLQEQLVQKDLPLLAQALGRELRVAVMKGRANYLCLLRFSSFGKAGSFRRLEELPVYRAVEAWATTTETGDRAEVPDMPDSVDFWREVSAASENCIGQSCSLFDACFVTRMRQTALEADLVVVNHHLLCADLAVKDGSYGSVIPAYDTLILDEAHLIEDVATQYFGVQVSSHKVEELVRDVERELKAASLDARELRAEAEGLRVRSERFFTRLARSRPGRLGPDWMTETLAEESLGLLQRLEGLRTALLAVPDRPEPLTGLAARTLALTSDVAFLMRAENDDHVYFAETRGRGVFLRAMPIDVSGRAQGAALRPGAGRGPDLGDARRRRRLRVREGPARHRAERRAAAAVALPLRGAGAALRPEGNARADGPRVRGPRRRGGGAARSSSRAAAPSCCSPPTRT